MTRPMEWGVPTGEAVGPPDGGGTERHRAPDRWTRRAVLAVGATALLAGCTDDGRTEVPGGSKNGSNSGSTNNTTQQDPGGIDVDGNASTNSTVTTTDAESDG